MPEDVPSMEVLGCQLLEHDQCIDVPQALMIESARKRAYHRVPELLPKARLRSPVANSSRLRPIMGCVAQSASFSSSLSIQRSASTMLSSAM